MSAPEWYMTARDIFFAQQSDVFLLHGNVLDYPRMPQESMTTFLSRMIRSEAVFNAKKKVIKAGGDGSAFDTLPYTEREEMVAEERIICSFSLTTGLAFESPYQEDAFNKVIGGPEDKANPYAKQPSQADDPQQAFAALNAYFRFQPREKETIPSLVLIIKRADLLFFELTNPTPQDKMLVDMVCEWTTGISSAQLWHRVFLLTPDRLKVYEHLRQGRVYEVKVPMPEQEARKRFIQDTLAVMEANQNGVILEEGLTVDQLAGLTGSLDLMSIEDVLFQGSLREDRTITIQAAQKRKDELVQKLYGGVMEIDYPTLTFEDIVGFGSLKQYMTGYVLSKLKDRDPMCPKGCLMAGPPGCTKTALARALANAMKLPLVMVRMDLVKNKYVGESNKNLARLTEGIVALAPCIVLFDEMDKMLGGGDSTGVNDELRGSLQTFVNDTPRGLVYFIGTSNYPEEIPPAMRRPGRFDTVIPMLPQHLDGERHLVLKSLARRMGLDHGMTDNDRKDIGDKAAMFTGADLELLISEADIVRSMRDGDAPTKEPRVSVQDFREALKNIVPTVEGTLEMIYQALRLTTNNRFVPESLREVAAEVKKAPDEQREDRLEAMRIDLDMN